MTPSRYSLKELRKLLSGTLTFSLYHWTGEDQLIQILNDQKIYSKGTLWGLSKLTTQTKTTKQDSINGFIDYVFLGVANWKTLGMTSFYGDFGLEFSPDVLQEKEFFVSKLNTGYQWQRMHYQDKFSDLSTLRNIVLNVASNANGSLSAEFLVRRKVVINTRVLRAIHCPSDKEAQLRETIPEEYRNMIQTYTRPAQNTDNPSLYLTYPGFTLNDEEELITPDRIVYDGIYAYVASTDSRCSLTLKLDRENMKVIDAASDEEVGRIA